MENRYKKILTDKADRKYAGLYYNFEVFYMLEKQIPTDTVRIEETVHAFSWEPVGSKFAIVHGDSQSNNMSFYGVKKGLQQPPDYEPYDDDVFTDFDPDREPYSGAVLHWVPWQL